MMITGENDIQDASPTSVGLCDGNLLRILFWNAHRHDLSSQVTALADDLSVDTIVLAEYDGCPYAVLSSLQKQVDSRFNAPFSTSDRFLVFTRWVAPEFNEVLNSERFSVRKYSHRNSSALLAIFHGLDPYNNDIHQRSSFALEKMRDLRKAMDEHNTKKALVVGDFNLNPFDPVMNQASGFNAMMTKNCVSRGSRRVVGQEYDFFYNPMWSFLGDLSPGSPGSIYYRGRQGQFGWNMFDQVLVHHSLISNFVEVQIINSHASIPLSSPRGHPNPVVSDHFPLLVTLRK
jgi:hypothetical protein